MGKAGGRASGHVQGSQELVHVLHSDVLKAMLVDTQLTVCSKEFGVLRGFLSSRDIVCGEGSSWA